MVKKKREGGALPPTGAGLIRYFDEDTKGIKLKPEYIVALVLFVIVLEIVLIFYGIDLLGF
ncbi:MAG: preprotein translocase subunit Sec61beta [Candidatus Methanofastidiosia archaeon]